MPQLDLRDGSKVLTFRKLSADSIAATNDYGLKISKSLQREISKRGTSWHTIFLLMIPTFKQENGLKGLISILLRSRTHIYGRRQSMIITLRHQKSRRMCCVLFLTPLAKGMISLMSFVSTQLLYFVCFIILHRIQMLRI